jgi:hypothetical protein
MIKILKKSVPEISKYGATSSLEENAPPIVCTLGYYYLQDFMILQMFFFSFLGKNILIL